MYTIKDVAREADVSIATVSRVINGKDRVKKETREKIVRAIEKLKYVPDQAARTMISKKTKTIGLVVPLLSNEYWAQMAEMMQRRLIKQGYSLLISTFNFDDHNDLSFLDTFMERKVEGVIIGAWPKPFSESDQACIGMLQSQNIALVSLAHVTNNVIFIGGDHLSSSMEAVGHLIRLGHHRIAYLGGAGVGFERELGYRNAFMLNRLQIDESLIVSERDHTLHYFSQYGYEQTCRLVTERAEFSALFCANDLIAIGAIKALEEHGLRVPEDIAVVGFDDITAAGYYRPALTTVKQPIEDMANAAADVLLEQIEHPDARSPQRKIMFPMQLVVRESCGSRRQP
jgi:DNA-binding LacI/PurR family transcriptional regulator